MTIEYLIFSLSILIVITLSILTISYLRKKVRNKLVSDLNNLDVKRNNLNSLPVMVEIVKIEDIAKSEQLEEKITEIKARYEDVKEIRLKWINDLISELDMSIEKRNYRDYLDKYVEIEMELDEAEYSLNSIMEEIKEIAAYEEKYRNIVIKLKAKFRFLEHSYTEKETMFKDLANVIKLQFENIAKRFQDFDKVMDEKLYNEVVLVVKSIDTMIDNLDVVIKELPDILLLLNDLIPGRINDLNNEYYKMIEEGYPLGYLDFENNLVEIEKRKADILTRAKILNITDSLLDLRTILEYLDSLFKDLDEEKKAKIKFDKLNEAYDEREKRLNKIVKDIYDELDDIKALYHLNEKDLEIIDQLNLQLAAVMKEHKKLLRNIKNKSDSYKKHNLTINELIAKINNITTDFDNALRTLGSFYEDEMRAHDELANMKVLYKKCREMIKNNRLPIIHNNYFIEEEESADAISEVEREINNKPIVIKSLNMRVETARDLTFKLYKTVKDMVNFAHFTEILIVYDNKYSDNPAINDGLMKAKMLYYKGDYQDSFNLLLKITKTVDGELVTKINKLLKNR